MSSEGSSLLDACELQQARYFTTSKTSSASSKPRKFRLYLAAADLHETFRRNKYACAVVYLRESNSLRANHISNVTEATEDAFTSNALSPKASSWSGTSAQVRNSTTIGRTEVARLCARDVEFSRSFVLQFLASASQIIHVDMYGCDSRSGDRSRLLGVAEVPLARLNLRRGARFSVPMAHPPAPPTGEKRRRGASGVGTLALCVEDVSAGLVDYCLDIQCEGIRRSKPFGSGRVRRVYYTIHNIASSDPACEHWSLLFRSDAVEMVKKKRDGGSLDYNYFSSRPLLATPGVIVVDKDDSQADSLLSKAHYKIKNRYKGQFFSLPSSAISSASPDRRLKLTLYDKSSSVAAAELIADTEFTVAQLRSMSLGEKHEMNLHSNAVGHATLKFVERGDDPKYFCLSVQLPNLK